MTEGSDWEGADEPDPLGGSEGDPDTAEAQVRDREPREVRSLSEVDRTTAEAYVSNLERNEVRSSGDLRAELDRQFLESRRQTLKLRKKYARYLLRIMITQLVVADVVFVVYGFFNLWDISPVAIDVWIGGTVVQVVGMTVVIVKYLFSDQPPV